MKRTETPSAGTNMTLVMFVLSLIILSVNAVLYSTSVVGGSAKTLLRLVAIGILALTIVFQRSKVFLSYSEMVVVALAVLVFLLGRNDALNILTIVLVGIGARSFEKDAMLRGVGVASLISVVFLIALLATGIVVDVNIVSYYATGAIRFRHNLGFYNPNTGALLFFGLIFAPNLVSKRRTVAWLVCLVTVMSVCIITGTRSIPATIALYIALIVPFKHLVKTNQLERLGRVALLIAVATLFVNLIIPLLADTQLDLTLSHRPVLTKELLSKMRTSDFIFGCYETIAIDNSYILTLSTGGFLLAGFLFSHYLRAVWNASIKGDYMAVALMLSLMVLGLLESFLMRPELVLCSGIWSLSFSYIDEPTTTLPQNGMAGSARSTG